MVTVIDKVQRNSALKSNVPCTVVLKNLYIVSTEFKCLVSNVIVYRARNVIKNTECSSTKYKYFFKMYSNTKYNTENTRYSSTIIVLYLEYQVQVLSLKCTIVKVLCAVPNTRCSSIIQLFSVFFVMSPNNLF